MNKKNNNEVEYTNKKMIQTRLFENNKKKKKNTISKK
jgi:hypothetical protein